MKLTLVLVVFGIVAFLVGTLTVPELGEANPRVKILAAISVAKAHREALDKACAEQRLRQSLTLVELGLGEPESYAGNFRSGVDVNIDGDTRVRVTVHLQALGQSAPAHARVQYTGECNARAMTWSRSSTPPDLLTTVPRAGDKPAA
mgnify:FL=1